MITKEARRRLRERGLTINPTCPVCEQETPLHDWNPYDLCCRGCSPPDDVGDLTPVGLPNVAEPEVLRP